MRPQRHPCLVLAPAAAIGTEELQLPISIQDQGDPVDGAGETRALTLMQRFFREFGLAMANVIAMIDPDVIVLGGGVSNIEGLYTEGAKETAARLPAYVNAPPIVRNQLGETAGAIGAAFIGIQ